MKTVIIGVFAPLLGSAVMTYAAGAELRQFFPTNVVKALIAYAITGEPFDNEAFAKALDGVSDDEIMANEGAPELVIKGFKLSGEVKRAETLTKRLERQKPPKK